jgi:acyl-coenzyme A synthetase/AMP-(fatty) acid ligase
VQEVAIVRLPHERWAEAPHAFVVLRQGEQTDEAELREFARANLAHFKAPDGVTFIKELPKTATGKIQKYVLRARDRVRSRRSKSTFQRCQSDACSSLATMPVQR